VSELAHGPDCECVRCKGFEPGNAVAVKHGAYATLKLAPRAAEIAEYLREAMAETYQPRFEIAIQSAGPIGARYEAALLALVESDASQLAELDHRARGWARLWFSVLDKLGLAPLAHSKQGMNLAVGYSAAQRTLDRHLAERDAES
jgi:hypothetical protein